MEHEVNLFNMVLLPELILKFHIHIHTLHKIYGGVTHKVSENEVYSNTVNKLEKTVGGTSAYYVF